jgi:hypothetical protein
MGRNLEDWIARTSEGQAFQKRLVEYKRQANLLGRDPNTMSSEDREILAEWVAENERYRQLSLTPGMVQQSTLLTNLSIAYRNDEYIGTRVMPVVSTGEKLTASYYKKPLENMGQAPDDEIGTSGTVKSVNEKLTTVPVALTRRALKEEIDAWTDDAADAPARELIEPTVLVADSMELVREQRIAGITGNSANYGSNTVALTSTDRWNDDSGGDPAGVVDAAKDALFPGMGPGMTIGVTNNLVYNVLRSNPVILEAYKYTKGGRVSRAQLADYFELDDILIGRARQNTANEGQTPSWSRIWPSVFAVLRVAKNPGRKNATFGVTFQSNSMLSTWFVPGDGGRGMYVTQQAYADVSVVTAVEAGFLITTPIG